MARVCQATIRARRNFLQYCGCAPPPAALEIVRVKPLHPAPILASMPGPWGHALYQLRTKWRLNKQEMARRAKVTPTTYGNLEMGRHTHTRNLQKVADNIGVPFEHVLIDHLSFGHGFAPSSPTESQGGRSHAHGVTFPSSATEEPNKELWAHIRNLEDTLAQYVAQQAVEHGIARERAAVPRSRKRQRPAADRSPRAQTAQRDTPARKRKP